MKRLSMFALFAALLIGSVSGLQAQTPSAGTTPVQTTQSATEPAPAETEYDIFEFTEDELPQFDMNEIQLLARYPEEARLKSLEGKVVMAFVVNTSGRAEKVEVVYSDNSVFNETSMNAIRQASFIPARHDGKPVRVRMTMALDFKFDN